MLTKLIRFLRHASLKLYAPSTESVRKYEEENRNRARLARYHFEYYRLTGKYYE